ncbi:MAG: hypothetical protein ACFFDN_43825 [Candidatus Hodarchaeota archaeon]
MHGKWVNTLSHLYHLAGFLYYISNLPLLIGGIGIFFSAFNFFRPQFSYLHYFIAPISLIIVFVGLYIWINKTKNQLKSHSPDLKLLLIRTKYRIIDDNNYIYSREVQAKALRHGVEYFKFKFFWTGHGEIVPHVENHQRKIELTEAPFGIHKVGKLYFGRPLLKNEIINLNYNLDLFDKEKTAKPFLSHNIHYQGLKKLILLVQFPTDNKIQFCYKQIFFDQSDIPIMEEKVDLSNNYEVSWEITRPRFGCRYQISW